MLFSYTLCMYIYIYIYYSSIIAILYVPITTLFNTILPFYLSPLPFIRYHNYCYDTYTALHYSLASIITISRRKILRKNHRSCYRKIFSNICVPCRFLLSIMIVMDKIVRFTKSSRLLIFFTRGLQDVNKRKGKWKSRAIDVTGKLPPIKNLIDACTRERVIFCPLYRGLRVPAYCSFLIFLSSIFLFRYYREKKGKKKEKEEIRLD